MLRFPFNSRPMPNRSHTGLRDANKPNVEEEPNNDEAGAEEKSEGASLSPELNFLLSMTMKDGLQENKMLNMLKDILPLTSGTDSQALRSILGAKSGSANGNSHTNSSLSQYSEQSRQQEMMNVMRRYSSKETGDMMNQFQKSIDMQKNFEKLGNMQNASPAAMMEAMSMFMPNQDMSQFKNMQNMMNMMNMMGNKGSLKPEDMMKFMNMNK